MPARSIVRLNCIESPLLPAPLLPASVGNTGALPMPRVCFCSQEANKRLNRQPNKSSSTTFYLIFETRVMGRKRAVLLMNEKH
jgi:hypothetical protein